MTYLIIQTILIVVVTMYSVLSFGKYVEKTVEESKDNHSLFYDSHEKDYQFNVLNKKNRRH